MNREEEIYNAALEYENSEQNPKDNEIRDFFKRGAKWADKHPINYDGKAYLYVGNKCAERTKKEFIQKAVEWLENHLLKYWSQINGNNIEEFVEQFKKAMKEL